MKKNRALLTVVAVAFAALGIYFGMRTPPNRPANDPVARLFASKLPDAKGATHDLAQWRGKTVLVNFWATWCAPCVEEMPELSALQAQVGPRGVQIIGIGIDNAANIAQFSTKYNISYPLYVAGMGNTDLLRDFGDRTGGLPFSVLIGPDGKLRKTYLGRLKLEQLRSDLNERALP